MKTLPLLVLVIIMEVMVAWSYNVGYNAGYNAISVEANQD